MEASIFQLSGNVYILLNTSLVGMIEGNSHGEQSNNIDFEIQDLNIGWPVKTPGSLNL